jgi:hypothetical protein
MVSQLAGPGTAEKIILQEIMTPAFLIQAAGLLVLRRLV